MTNRVRFPHLVSAFAVCTFLWSSVPATAQSTCSNFGTISIDGGAYLYQQDEWNSSATQCATVSGQGFTLTTANFNLPTNGAPADYPSIYRGCHWGACTSSNPFPIEENNIASASSSVTITQPSGYNNDAAYDIWFNQTSTTSGQPNGTEVMIWINHQGSPQPFGSQVATATIDGTPWEVWTGRQSSWNIVSYVRQTPVTSVSNLDLLPFFSDAVARGSLQPSWWLIDVEYGFEIWTGGQGLGISNFAVSAAAGGGGGSGASCIAVPSAPSGLKGAAASSSVINVSWTADTAPANCTISGYNVFRSTTSGFTPSAGNQIASGVTSTSYSDSGLAPATTYYYAVQAVDTQGVSAASAQASAQTAAPSGSGACHIGYSITNQWPGGFGASVTIQNTGSVALTSWTLTWNFANGQTITQLWNGNVSQSGSAVKVTNMSYNGSIPAGGSLTGMGFNGTWNSTSNAVPTSFSLNGQTCK